MTERRLYALTSGWDGPFQLSEVIVVARDEDAAIDLAEAAFADARQPVCKAKMEIADLGIADHGTTTPPRRRDQRIDANWRPIDQRCAPTEARPT